MLCISLHISLTSWSKPKDYLNVSFISFGMTCLCPRRRACLTRRRDRCLQTPCDVFTQYTIYAHSWGGCQRREKIGPWWVLVLMWALCIILYRLVICKVICIYCIYHVLLFPPMPLSTKMNWINLKKVTVINYPSIPSAFEDVERFRFACLPRCDVRHLEILERHWGRVLSFCCKMLHDVTRTYSKSKRKTWKNMEKRKNLPGFAELHKL